MRSQNTLSLDQVSRYFNIEIEIVSDFAEFGLFPTIYDDGKPGVEPQNLNKLAEIVSLYQALGVNKEGIEVVLKLRERILGLEDEIARLQSAVERLKILAANEDLEELNRRGLLIEIDD